MKILILSDSHGNIENLNFALENTKVDKILYLGDGVRDLQYFKDYEIEAVKGNCDLFYPLEDEKILNIDNITLFITHGHRYSVKYQLDEIKNKAKQVGAKIVCFGHTHKFLDKDEDNIKFINPGSIGCGNECSFVILTIKDNKFSVCKIPVINYY